MLVLKAGADIAKEHLDVCVIEEGKPLHKRFPNTFAGFVACLKWFRSFAETAEIAFEPTGRYGELFVEFMLQRGCTPLQVEPYPFSIYAKGLDIRVKSDRQDSYALARYCIERADRCRKAKQKTPDALELRDLQLLLNSQMKRVIMIKCQLSCGLRSRYVRSELQLELQEIEQRVDITLDRAEAIIRLDKQLAGDLERLLEIPGIGTKTAVMLLTLVDFRAFNSARSLACFLGLTSRKHESGTSIKGASRMSKRGSTYIRSQLFMPARSSRRWDEAMAAFSGRLLARGKHDYLVQVAVIRRMVTVAWAVVKKGEKYDPNYKHPLSPT